jgi:hypothetical protein
VQLRRFATRETYAAMLTRILAVAVLILVVMIAARDDRLMKKYGLTAACSVVQTLPDGSQLAACHPGRLEGRPDLSNRGCIDAGIAGTVEYWKCPAASAAAYRP